MVIGAALLLVGVAGWNVLSPPSPAENPNVLSYEEGGFLYTYHPVSRTEALFDVTSDPRRLRNLSLARPAETALLRGKLARRLGVADLRDFDDATADPLRTKLRGLGYLR